MRYAHEDAPLKQGTVLWQCNVGEKQNEISALKPLITPSLVKGRIVTVDAMHTRAPSCVRRCSAVEERMCSRPRTTNPPSPKTLPTCLRIAHLIGSAGSRQRRGASRHGRLEHRQITCSPDLGDWFGKQWQGLEQVFRLERTTCILKTGEIRHQLVYGLSSLSLPQAGAPRMLELVRNHWNIENRLHWRRDVTLGEDRCQTRTGAVPGLLARLNSTVLSLMDRLGVRNVARQIRYFDAAIEQAIQLLLTGQCFVF
jgi:predicted transposase YbfD/YdcC